MNLIFIVSTGGAVLGKLLEHEIVCNNTYCVVSDRQCGALSKAEERKVPTEILSSSSGLEFSQSLNKRFKNDNFIFISFYTKLLTMEFLEGRKGSVFNCHPSILPACKGLNGFEDTLLSNSLFIGCTLHEVDVGIDAGRSVIQGAFPLDRGLEFDVNRHKVFLMQYYSTLQFIKWVVQGDFISGENWKLKNFKFEPSVFSPNLDDDFFKFFDINNEL